MKNLSSSRKKAFLVSLYATALSVLFSNAIWILILDESFNLTKTLLNFIIGLVILYFIALRFLCK